MATATKAKPARVPRYQKQAIRQAEREHRAKKREHRQARRAARRKVYTGIVGAVWAGRRPLGVLYLAAVAYVAALVAGWWPRNVAGIAVILTITAVLVVWRVGRRKVRCDVEPWSPFRHRFWIAVLAADTGWLVAATRYGTGAPMPGVLLSLTAVGSVAWLVHMYWPKPEPEKPEPVAVDDRLVRWRDVAGAEKPLPAKTRLHSIEAVTVDVDGDTEPDMMGWTGTVQLPAGSRSTWLNVVSAADNIAAAFDVPSECVVVERTADRVPSRARLTVLDRRNPTHDVAEFDPSWIDLVDGCHPAGVFPDGIRSWIRLFEPNSGPVHDMYSGDSGSGKSRGIEHGITAAALTGLCVPFVADPQGGQSMPAWAGRDGRAVWKATTFEESMLMFTALERLMLSRSHRLTQREWIDEDGTVRRGLDYYDPHVITDMPIVDVTIDEAHMILANKKAADVVERIARMARKTGIRLRLATQYPSINDLGNRMAIRNQMGNLVCYRISTRTVDGMILPSWAPSPFDIPQVVDGGKHTKGMNFTHAPAPGGDRRTFQRRVWVRRAHFWADKAAERIPALPREDQDAMGDAWYQRAARAAELDGGVVIDMASRPAPNVAPKTTGVASPSTRDNILAYLAEHDGPVMYGAIAAAIGMPRSATSNALSRLRGDGLVTSPRRGEWQLVRERELVSA